MVYLISDGLACGVAYVAEVRTPFPTLADAQSQAEADSQVGRTPLRIEAAETGEVLWEPPAAS